MVNKIIEWECPHCKDRKKSYSWENNRMDNCKCGKSGIDLEEYYHRIIGDAKIIREGLRGNSENTLQMVKKVSCPHRAVRKCSMLFLL